MVKTNEIKRNYYLNLFSGNAEITDNINDFPNSTIISGYSSLVGGSGYIYPPNISVNGSCPGFVATTVLTATSVSSTNYTITNRGSGYAANDAIVFNNTGTGGGSGVVATINILSGLITGYSALVGGTNYNNAPTLTATGGGTGFIGSTLLTNTTVNPVFSITTGGTGYVTGESIIFNNTGTGGSGAVATITATGGVITGIALSNGGSGYNIRAPTLTINSVNGKNGVITCSLVGTTVASIIITSEGSGYSTSPTFVFTPIGTGSGASATPTITNGIINSLTFTNNGSGYTLQPPTITSITTSAGVNGAITFNLNPTSVGSISITNGGSGYASSPLTFVFTPNPTLGSGLGSGASAIATTRATKNKTFRWGIRDLQLGRVAEIALIQLVHTNAANNTGYAIRCYESFADGYDSYNITSAVLYLGLGLNSPSITTYHKLLSQNLNSITLVCTDDLTSAATVSAGFNKNITFSVILEVVDYVDEQNTY